MSNFRPDSEMHRVRMSRNLGLGAVLLGFVALVFALTVVKVTRGNPMQAFDHQPRIEMAPQTVAPQTNAPQTSAPQTSAPQTRAAP